MAGQERNRTKKRRTSKLSKYFYLNGELCTVLHSNRPGDSITLWSYPRKQRVGYNYSDVMSLMKPAFTTTEVAKMLMRTKLVLELAILNGDIDRPQILTDVNGREYKYMWSEDDIMAMHAVLLTRHRGRPRKDGLIRPQTLPSAREVRALIRDNAVLYVKTDDGDYVPTWQAEVF